MDGAAKFRVRRWFSFRTRRGYGVHSPFAYSLIRSVFGPEGRRVANEIDILAEAGFDSKTAGCIERLYRACGCENIVIDRTSADEDPRRTLFLVSADGADSVTALKEAAARNGGVLCLIDPRKGRIWRESCRRIAREHDGMGIESRRLMIISMDKGLNKQHIRV